MIWNSFLFTKIRLSNQEKAESRNVFRNVILVHVNTPSHYTMNMEFHKSFWMVYVDVDVLDKTWMEGTFHIPYKNPYFFVTTEPNQMGFSQRFR